MRKVLLCAALAFQLAACGSDDERIDALEERLAVAEARVQQLEEGLAVADVPVAGRSTGAPVAQDPLLEAAEDRVEEAVETGGSSDIRRLIEAAFSEVPEFGSDDPEFGGVLLRGEGQTVELVLRRNGLLHLDSLELALVSLGFDEPSIRGLLESGDGGVVSAESVDGFTRAEATGAEDELVVVLSPT